MKKKVKKLVSLVLSVVMICTVMPSVFAETEAGLGFIKVDLKSQANGVIFMDGTAEGLALNVSSVDKNVDFVTSGGLAGELNTVNLEGIQTANRDWIGQGSVNGTGIDFEIPVKRAVSTDFTEKETVIVKAGGTDVATINVPDGYYKELYVLAFSGVNTSGTPKVSIRLGYNGSEETKEQEIYYYYTQTEYDNLRSATQVPNGTRIEMCTWDKNFGASGTAYTAAANYYMYTITTNSEKVLQNITITATDNATAIMGLTGNMYINKTKEYAESLLAGGEDTIEKNYSSLNEMIAGLEKVGINRFDMAGIENLVIIDCTDLNGNSIYYVSKDEQLTVRIKASMVSSEDELALYAAAYKNGKLTYIKEYPCDFSESDTQIHLVKTPDEEFSEFKLMLFNKKTYAPYAASVKLDYAEFSPVGIETAANGRIYLDDSSDMAWDGGVIGGLYSEFDFITFSDALSSRFAIKKSSLDSMSENGIITKNGVPYHVPEMASGPDDKEAVIVRGESPINVPINKALNKVYFLAATQNASDDLDVTIKYIDGTESYCDNIALLSGYEGANSTAENFVCRPESYVAWYDSEKFSSFSRFSIFEYSFVTDADKIIKEIEFSSVRYSCAIIAVTGEKWNNNEKVRYIEEQLKNAELIQKDGHLLEQLKILASQLDETEKESISNIGILDELEVIPREVYVDPNVAAAASENTFSTIEQAQEYIRTIPRNGRYGMKVFIKGSEYQLTDGLVFTKDDSGVLGNPITYSSYDGEVVFSGTQKVDMSKANAVTSESIRNRIPEDAVNNVLEINLAEQGLSGLGEVYDGYMYYKPRTKSPELIWDGEPLTRSRWPNENGWAYVDEYKTYGTPHYGVAPDANDDGTSFTIKDGSVNFEKWSNAEDAVLVGSWWADWGIDYLKLDSVDVATGIIKTKTSPSKEVGGAYSSNCFYIENILEELDSPGEWFIDKTTDMLYVYPPTELTSDTVVEFAVLESDMMELNNTEHLRVENINFSGGRKNAVNMYMTDSCEISGCEIKNFLTSGVSFVKAVKSGVQSCDIKNTGSNGIYIKGNEEYRKKLIPDENYVDNCTISNVGRQFMFSSVAVAAYIEDAVGTKISNNEIYDVPNVAIMFIGNNNIIEYNDIHNAVTQTGDVGAIYAGQRFTDQGNIIRYNYIHDINQNISRKHSSVVGIYLDDMDSGVTAFGNIINRVHTGALIGGGKNITFKNNIIMNGLEQVGSETYNDLAINADSRGLGWMSGSVAPNAEEAKAWWNNEAWQKDYPWMENNYFDNMQAYPTGNDISNNLIYNHKAVSISSEHAEYGNVKKNVDYTYFHKLVYGEIFVDESTDDLRLIENSGAFKAISGFENIPFEKIGTYADEYRE